MKSLALQADPYHFQLINLRDARTGVGTGAVVVLRDDSGRLVGYSVENLYIVNGILMHRDWLGNTVLGNVGFVAEQRT